MVNNHKRITAVFAALADPTRLRILDHLATGGEHPVTALGKPFRISAPAVSRHLRVLEKAKLIERRRAGRLHFIRGQPAGLKEAQHWIDHYVAGWDFSFDALDRLLQKDKERGKKQS